jgi:hypothetical protein
MGGIYEVSRSDGFKWRFIKIGSDIQTLMGEGIHRHTDSMVIS